MTKSTDNQVNTSSYAIIPSYILDDPELAEGAKNLYARISMYSNEGRCWASNKHFSDKHGVTTRSFQRWLKQLSDKGYIVVEIETGVFKTERNIWITNDFKNQNTERYSRRVMGDTNVDNINTSTINKIPKKSVAKPESTSVHKFITQPEEKKSVADGSATASKSSKKDLIKKKKEERPMNEKRPYRIEIKTPSGTESITQDDLHYLGSRLASAHPKLKIEDLLKAWEILANYSGIVYDWHRFIEGTIENFKTQEKPKHANNGRKKTCQKKTSNDYKQDCSEDDTPEQALLKCNSETIKTQSLLMLGLKTQKTS